MDIRHGEQRAQAAGADWTLCPAALLGWITPTNYIYPFADEMLHVKMLLLWSLSLVGTTLAAFSQPRNPV